MYWLSMSMTDTMIRYLESAPSLSIACMSLERLNEDHTKLKKLLLKVELNIMKQGSVSINDYASKIEGIPLVLLVSQLMMMMLLLLQH